MFTMIATIQHATTRYEIEWDGKVYRVRCYVGDEVVWEEEQTLFHDIMVSVSGQMVTDEVGP